MNGRKMMVHDLPCTCGVRLADHGPVISSGERPCPSGDGIFRHAETEPVAPQEGSSIGHIYRGPDRHLYTMARRVTFPNTDGTDFEIAPFEADPDVDPKDSFCRFERRLISSAAIGRTYHHSRRCPCEEGYAR